MLQDETLSLINYTLYIAYLTTNNIIRKKRVKRVQLDEVVEKIILAFDMVFLLNPLFVRKKNSIRSKPQISQISYKGVPLEYAKEIVYLGVPFLQ